MPLRSISSLLRDKHVLVVECGNGTNTKRLIEASRPASVVALEPGHDYEEARRRLSSLGITVHKLELASAVAERRHQEAYDVVTALGWRPVKRDADRFVQNLAGAIHRDGIVIITMKWEEEAGADDDDDDNDDFNHRRRRGGGSFRSPVVPSFLSKSLDRNFLSVDISSSEEVLRDGSRATKVRIICESPAYQETAGSASSQQKSVSKYFRSSGARDDSFARLLDDPHMERMVDEVNESMHDMQTALGYFMNDDFRRGHRQRYYYLR